MLSTEVSSLPRAPCAANDTRALAAEAAKPLSDALAALLPDLTARAMRLCRHRAAAEDLVQDTVERALRFQGQFVAGSSLRAWAYTVLFSVFVTRYRRARRERRALTSLVGDPCAWTTPMPPGTSPQAELLPSTQRELMTLPEGFREAVVLVDLQDLSYREAAVRLGVPLGTVMSRLHRGRRLLAGRLVAAA